MVAILDFVPDQVEPAALRALSQAFDQTCASLHLPADMMLERQIIARRIIHLARTGLIDAEALRDRVVQEARLPPP